jgi:hypothetical protein
VYTRVLKHKAKCAGGLEGNKQYEKARGHHHHTGVHAAGNGSSSVEVAQLLINSVGILERGIQALGWRIYYILVVRDQLNRIEIAGP